MTAARLRRYAPLALLTVTLASSAGAQCSDSPTERDGLRASLVAPEYADIWRRYGLTVSATDSVVLVTDSIVCRRVAEAIAKDRSVAVGSFTFVLVRTGSHHVAESDLPAGQFLLILVLDSTGTRVTQADTTAARAGLEERPHALPRLRNRLKVGTHLVGDDAAGSRSGPGVRL